MKNKNIFSTYTQLLALIIAIAFTSCNSKPQPEEINIENARLKGLIVNGQMNNSHDDQQSSPVIERILELTGEFNIEVATSPKKEQDMSTFSPNFSDYDVIILDYDGDEWPETTKTNFVDYVKNGGGVVVVHSADNAFPDWKEFN